MTPLLKRASMKAFIAAIFAMGVIRFVLTVSGLPDSFVKYFSMTVLWVAGALYFALATETHKERLRAAYLLTLPYMIIEVAALGYTWASGRQTIFHAKVFVRHAHCIPHAGTPGRRADMGAPLLLSLHGNCLVDLPLVPEMRE